jgi:Ni/Co efflux regulator RcnB
MRIQSIICLSLSLALGTSGLALAQRGGDNRERGRQEQGDRGDRGEGRDGARDERGNGRGPPPQWDNRGRGNAYGPAVREGRGAGPDDRYYRGDRLPEAYRSRRYVVDDWRGHHLSAPPRGYQWVQSGGDYLLVAIATGLILQLLLNN